MARICRALGSPTAAGGLYDLAKNLNAPLTLKELGMTEAGLDKAAGIAAANPYSNPSPITREGVRKLLDDAYHGRRPQN